MTALKDKVAIITGAAGNLGQAVAHKMVGTGAHVVLVDRSMDRLPQMFSELVDVPDHMLVGGIDLAVPGALDEVVTHALAQWGRIDILVNTVGGYRAGTPVHETPVDTLDFMLTLNVRTLFLACQAVIPHMLEQGSGKIVNVAARAGLTGGKNSAAYSASKAGVIRLTESMAGELKRAGINVNCILPGTIDTPDNRAAMPAADYSKWVAPEALADAILFLASDAARAVHGAALPVYGLS